MLALMPRMRALYSARVRAGDEGGRWAVRGGGGRGGESGRGGGGGGAEV